MPMFAYGSSDGLTGYGGQSPGGLGVGIVGPASLFQVFFFQAEDGIRDLYMTGVQTCALPISELLGRTTAPALAFDDPRVAKENLSLLRFRPLVSSAAIYNARGGLFATYARADDPRGFPKLPEPDSARVDERDLVVFKRIVSDGEILGTVFVRSDYELFDRVYDYLGIAAVVLIAAMLVALLMSSWMQNIVTRPILAIA